MTFLIYAVIILNRFAFYDGPPFATGLPHYGHILAGTIKDIVTRFAHQSGFFVERRFGWDCHGLPVVSCSFLIVFLLSYFLLEKVKPASDIDNTSPGYAKTIYMKTTFHTSFCVTLTMCLDTPVKLPVCLLFALSLLLSFVKEYEIDKSLGIKGPEDVAKIGIAEYNNRCRSIVMRYAADWEVMNRKFQFFFNKLTF